MPTLVDKLTSQGDTYSSTKEMNPNVSKEVNDRTKINTEKNILIPKASGQLAFVVFVCGSVEREIDGVFSAVYSAVVFLF